MNIYIQNHNMDFQNSTRKDLVEYIQNNGLKNELRGYSRLRKAALIQMLENHRDGNIQRRIGKAELWRELKGLTQGVDV